MLVLKINKHRLRRKLWGRHSRSTREAGKNFMLVQNLQLFIVVRSKASCVRCVQPLTYAALSTLKPNICRPVYFVCSLAGDTPPCSMSRLKMTHATLCRAGIPAPSGTHVNWTRTLTAAFIPQAGGESSNSAPLPDTVRAKKNDHGRGSKRVSGSDSIFEGKNSKKVGRGARRLCRHLS